MLPVLLNLPLEQGVRYIKDNRSIQQVGNRTQIVYLNDIVILEVSRPDHQSTFKLTDTRQRKQLTINEDKTKYTIMFRRSIDKQNLCVDPYIFEMMNNFKYRGES